MSRKCSECEKVLDNERIHGHVNSDEVQCHVCHVAGDLKPCEQRTLVACALKHERETVMSQKNPKRVKNHYFAYGPEKRAARHLMKLGLLSDNSSICSTGADIYPSELGTAVAMEVIQRQQP